MFERYGTPSIIASAWSLLLSFSVSLLSGAEVSSTIITLSVIGYLLASALDAPLRLPLLVSAVGAHIASLITYYSNPIPLPLIVLERSSTGIVANIDIVQLIAMSESAYALKTASCQRAGEKDSKTPEEILSEDGPQAGSDHDRVASAGAAVV